MTTASPRDNSRLQWAFFTALTVFGLAGLLYSTTPALQDQIGLQSIVQAQEPAGTVSSKQQTGSPQDKAFRLREVRANVFESPAGLLYLPGSAEGHRIDHVAQHLQDNPAKKLHGVFEGDRNRWLATIDEAWRKSAAGGPLVKRQQQNNRTVTTVNLKRRLGYVGGSEGAEDGNPECRLVRIVTENRREVITAYPVQAF